MLTKRYSPRLTRSGKAYGRISVYVNNDNANTIEEIAAKQYILPEIVHPVDNTPSSSVECAYTDVAPVEFENAFELVTARRRTKKRRNSIFPRAAILQDVAETPELEECPPIEFVANDVDALADVTVFVDDSELGEQSQVQCGTIKTQMVMRNGKRKKVVVVEQLDPTLLRPPPSSSCLKSNRANPAKNFRWADARNEAPLCHLKVVEQDQFTHNFRQSTKKQSMFGKVL